MKPIVLMGAALAVLFGALSCTVVVNGKRFQTIKGQGALLTREYELADFDAIRVSGSYDIHFIQTEGEYGVSVETFENIFELLDIDVDGTTLVLGQVGEKRFRTDKLDVTVKGPSLRSVRVEGTADLLIDGFRSEEDLDMLVLGAGDFDLKHISCRDLQVEISGAGDLNVTRLTCESANVSVNGAGDVDMDFIAAPEVRISVSGAGDIRLSGDAGKVFCQVSGAGSVDARSLRYESFDSSKAGIASIKK